MGADMKDGDSGYDTALLDADNWRLIRITFLPPNNFHLLFLTLEWLVSNLEKSTQQKAKQPYVCFDILVLLIDCCVFCYLYICTVEHDM